jgi:predicted nucleic acid-binding protein
MVVATYFADTSFWMTLSRKRDQYNPHAVKNWSLTDCLSFVVMERRQLKEAPTTDRHFEQAGLKVMMLQQPAP